VQSKDQRVERTKKGSAPKKKGGKVLFVVIRPSNIALCQKRKKGRKMNFYDWKRKKILTSKKGRCYLQMGIGGGKSY